MLRLSRAHIELTALFGCTSVRGGLGLAASGGHTIVASMARSDPCHSGKPLATTSLRRASAMSANRTFWANPCAGFPRDSTLEKPGAASTVPRRWRRRHDDRPGNRAAHGGAPARPDRQGHARGMRKCRNRSMRNLILGSTSLAALTFNIFSPTFTPARGPSEVTSAWLPTLL